MPDPGSIIGHYEVLGELGRGGMGIVYRARDPRLDRDVAIKALPEDLASDPARLERFEREGKALAQLNHPNIAGIHGVEEHDGHKYLILEYVEGDTLGDRLEAGALPVEEAVELAAGIAAGLEAAHDVGIIHRDLKPDNIKVTPADTVKVLDFGLAKTSEVGSSVDLVDARTAMTPRSPTIPGAILGTAAYMSPEQARGRHVDKRTDIWSFGVVLYEMLTGASPFVGETATDSIGAVLHKDIDLQRLSPGTPHAVRRVLERCLERDKSLRYRDIGDVRIELLRATNDTHEQPPTTSRRHPIALAVMCVIATVAAAGWYMATSTAEQPRRAVRKFDVMRGTLENPIDADRARISPDGARIAFIRNDLVQVRDLASFEARPMGGTEGATTLFWSPDSKWIGFTTGDEISKVALAGGGVVKVCDADSNIDWDLGCGWTIDDRIVYREQDHIAQVTARGGEPTPLLMVDSETELDFHSPTVIPGTNVVLFIEHRRDSEFGLAAFDGTTRVMLTDSRNEPLDSPAFCSSGHVLFVRGFRPKNVWAIGFDPGRMEVTSEPFLVLPDASQPSVAEDGTLVVHRGDAPPAGQLVFAGLDGTVEPIGDPFDLVVSPLLSPDERKIALTTGKPGMFDVWVIDLERGSRNRITFTESMTFAVGWSPDSTELATVILGGRRDARLATSFHAADGSGETRPPIDTGIMSLDASWTVGVATDELMGPTLELNMVSLDATADRPTVIELKDGMAGVAAINPAGTLLAYVTRESGQPQVFCTRFPSGAGKWQISIRGGTNPRWLPDGSRLYFEQADGDKRIYAVEVTTEPSVRFGIPEEVLDAEALGVNLTTGWAVTGDGKRFVTSQSDIEDDQERFISVIENWYEAYRDQ